MVVCDIPQSFSMVRTSSDPMYLSDPMGCLNVAHLPKTVAHLQVVLPKAHISKAHAILELDPGGHLSLQDGPPPSWSADALRRSQGMALFSKE